MSKGRSRKGQSRAIGAAFEEELAWLHQQYNANGFALMRHNGTQATMRGEEWIPQDSPPDYTGLITCQNGRYVSFDAKQRNSAHYYHARNKLHQTQKLWEDQQAGGIAFLLVLVDAYLGGTPRAWVLWPQEYWQDHYPAWSLNLPLTGSIDPAIAVEVPRWDRVSHGFIPDWLKVIHPALVWP